MRSTASLSSLVAALLLSACGGGGGGARSADEGSPPPALASTTQILVDPKSDGDLSEIESETGAHVVGPVEGTSYWIVELPPGANVAEFLSEMDGDDRVEAADEDEGAQFPEGGLSTIPLFGDDPLATIATQPAMTSIGAPAARTRATGAGVLVAVVDTGIVSTDPAVAGHVAPGAGTSSTATPTRPTRATASTTTATAGSTRASATARSSRA